MMIKKIIVWVLQLEARAVLRKYKPEIIAITGSVGKTSAKEAIATILADRFFVRKSAKSYNSELGVPLTILGLTTGWDSPTRWLQNLIEGAKLVFKKQPYPELLILEIGADRPGDISAFVRWVRPHVVVVTAIGEIPVHVEFFAGREELAREKAALLRRLMPKDVAILNADDKVVADMAHETRARHLLYGKEEHAAVRGTEYMLTYRTDPDGIRRPLGVAFKADYKGSTVPIKIDGVFGRPIFYAVLSAIAVAAAKGMNLVDAAAALSRFHGVPGRLRLLEGIKGSLLIDDSYNASPTALHAALDLLHELPARRRFCILGDMLEIGRLTIQAHMEAGKRLAEFADVLITVGSRAKFIAEGARERGMDNSRIFSYVNREAADEDIDAIQERLGAGDVILVKGSQGMRLEYIVEALMAHPEQATELLVRQEKEWQIRR